MKNISIKIKTKSVLIAVFALAAVGIFSAQPVMAEDWGYWDTGSYGGYWDSTPIYSDYSGYWDSTPIYSSGSGYWDSTPIYSSYTPSYSYSTPSYSYTPSSSGYSYVPSSSGYSYVTSPSSSGGYTYTPQTQYQYVSANPTATANSTSSNTSKQWTYVSNTNTNTNSNTNNNSNTASNTNNINNSTSVTNNPTFVNNNNPTNSINLVVLGAGSGSTNTTTSLDGNCVISPSNAYVNQDVTFSASATGGNGSYSYSWNGSDGIYSNNQSFTGRFSNPGYKTATVTITSNGQSITRSCSANVQSSYSNNLSAYCVANPSNAYINQTVTWTVYATGGNGGYSYSWSGENLYGNSQSVNTSYSTSGNKYATVSVYSNGQTISASCNANIYGNTVYGGNVNVYRDTNLGTPVSGVFLSQVPATGISFNMKMALFAIGLIAWSLFAAYVVNEKRKAKFATAGAGSISKIEQFKRSNMIKKGII